MGVLGAIRIDGLIDQVLSNGPVSDHQKNVKKLQKIAKTSIPKLAERLESSNKEESKQIIDVLSELATT